MTPGDLRLPSANPLGWFGLTRHRLTGPLFATVTQLGRNECGVSNSARNRGRFNTLVHAYALMDNHYHLLLETPEANLSRAMHWLNAR